MTRLVVLLWRLLNASGGRRLRSQANVTVALPLFSVVDFPVVKAYPFVIAHKLIASNKALRELYTFSGGRQSSAKWVAMAMSLAMSLTMSSVVGGGKGGAGRAVF